MKVLGKIPAQLLVHFGAVEMLFVVVLCYALAVSFGHVEPFLPTISACGERPPEQYPFRYGVLLAGLLLVLQAWAVHTAGRSSAFTFVISVIAGLSLGVVAVVSTKDDNTVHNVFAVTFFVLEDIASILLTLDMRQRLSVTSFITKVICCAVACAATITRVLVVTGHCPATMQSASFPLVPVVEWLNTFALLGFQWSLGNDLTSLYLATVEDSEPVVKQALLGEKQKLSKQIANETV